MRSRLQRLIAASGAALALSGLFLAAVPARAAVPAVGSLAILKLPDLVIFNWSVGQMWDTATNSTVPAVIVTVKNVGNRASSPSTTRIVHNEKIYNMPTPALSPDQSIVLAAPLSNGSLCGFLSITVDNNNNNVEWNETNSLALFIDCFPPPP